MRDRRNNAWSSIGSYFVCHASLTCPLSRPTVFSSRWRLPRLSTKCPVSACADGCSRVSSSGIEHALIHRTENRRRSDLEHPVVVSPFLLWWNRFRESPVLNDLFVLDSVQVDVDARATLMRSLGSYEDEISLPEQEPDLIDGSVLRDLFEITLKRRESVADTGLVADLICSNVMRDLAVVSSDVNGLVVLPDNRLVLLCVR
jgi:hypothetical protein